MALRLGDIAPDFNADTTEGPISFHEWIGDGWAVLVVDVRQHELRAFAREEPCRGRTHSRRRTRDDRDLVPEPHPFPPGQPALRRASPGTA